MRSQLAGAKEPFRFCRPRYRLRGSSVCHLDARSSGALHTIAATEIAQIMANVGCKQAERLLWEYLQSLADSNGAQLEYIEAIRSGSTGSIRAKEKASKGMTDRVRDARNAFEEHAAEHACCPSPMEALPHPGRKTC
jgi:hypothetical protein